MLGLLLGSVHVPAPESDPDAIARLVEVCGSRHEVEPSPVDLEGYSASGLPTRTMGRELSEDQAFFAAALASGRALAEAAAIKHR